MFHLVPYAVGRSLVSQQVGMDEQGKFSVNVFIQDLIFVSKGDTSNKIKTLNINQMHRISLSGTFVNVV